jgi:hypothetical protein
VFPNCGPSKTVFGGIAELEVEFLADMLCGGQPIDRKIGVGWNAQRIRLTTLIDRLAQKNQRLAASLGADEIALVAGAEKRSDAEVLND